MEHSPNQLKSILEKGAASYVISTGFTKIVAIINTLLVLTSLTTYAYGVAELALSVVGVFSIFQLSGLERTVIADMGVEKGKGDLPMSRRLFNDFIVLLTALSLTAWGVLYFGSEIVGQFFTAEIGSYFTIISFLFLVAPASAVLRILFSVYLDFTASALFTFLQEASKLVFIAWFFLFDTISISVVLWAYVIASSFPTILLLPRTFVLLKKLHTLPARGKSMPLRFFRDHNLWTLLSNYLDTVTKSFRVWLIKLFLGTEVVALYAVATGFVGHLSSFLNISSVVGPVLPQYVHDRPIFYKIIDKTIKYQLLLALAVVSVGLILVPVIVEILFPQYEASLPLFALLVVSLLPSGINNVFQTMFYTLKAQKNLFFSQITKLFFVMCVGTASLVLFGFFGIVVEYLSTVVFFGIERYRVLRKLYPDFRINFRDFLQYDEYDKLLIQRFLARFSLKLTRRISGKES